SEWSWQKRPELRGYHIQQYSATAHVGAFAGISLPDTESKPSPGANMEPQVNSPTNTPSRKSPPGSPYCSDPNCPYCTELRETQELVRTGKPVPRTMKRSA